MCRGGEMADAPALGAGTRKGVEVRVLSSAPFDSYLAEAGYLLMVNQKFIYNTFHGYIAR